MDTEYKVSKHELIVEYPLINGYPWHLIIDFEEGVFVRVHDEGVLRNLSIDFEMEKILNFNNQELITHCYLQLKDKGIIK
jgi:hypothetical protein